MLQTNLPNESETYLEKREELRLAEIALMQQRERVAEMRRTLPESPPMQDYVMEEGPARLDAGDSPICNVRLSELFTNPDRPLIIYQMMYGKKQTNPCPMCTAWVDALNGVAPHLDQTINLAVVVAADVPTIRAFARTRGWDKVRLVSAADSTFKYDLRSEDSEGNQDSEVSVFTLGSDGVPRHFYSAHPRLSPNIKMRGIDLLNPLWHFLDLTPKGRGNFDARLDYPVKPRE